MTNQIKIPIPINKHYNITGLNGEKGVILENDNLKILKSENYNFIFNKETGYFERYGKEVKDDPDYSIFGPEILDLEVSTICHGIHHIPCPHCYKSNTGLGQNMTLDEFKTVFHKMPRTLTQIAFGIGDIDSNPDLFKMFEYCRNNDYQYIIPNVTINGDKLDDDYAYELKKYCGAVAVSRYSIDPCVCYDAVNKLTKLGMKQINIHMLLSKETLPDCYKLIEDIKHDKRLQNLNAVVFLFLKPKGKRNSYNMVTYQEYSELMKTLEAKEIKYGFDSCSAPFYLKYIEGKPEYEHMAAYAEPCESSIFSSYINHKGEYWHCSFTEGKDGWTGIDVLNCNDFITDVWFNNEAIRFRNQLLNQEHKCKECRTCPVYNLYGNEKF